MADLRTRYLGMELRSPLVASSSPLTGSLDGLRRLEAAGAGAVVLPSLFEEEIAEASPRPGAWPVCISGSSRPTGGWRTSRRRTSTAPTPWVGCTLGPGSVCTPTELR
jgi:hypothetical protein